MNLYELTNELQCAIDALQTDPETGEVSGWEAVDALDVAFDDKAEAYALTIKNLLAFADSADAEADKLKARAKSAKKRAEHLREHLAQSMAAVGKTQVETARASIKFRRSEAVLITNDSLIPEDWWKVRITREPNKVEIKKHLKAGEVVPGAELETRMNLQIK